MSLDSTHKEQSMLTLLSNSSWVFVDGLSLYYTADDIMDLFARFGTVRTVRLKLDAMGMSLRCAYIEMATHADAERAILLANAAGRALQAMHTVPPS